MVTAQRGVARAPAQLLLDDPGLAQHLEVMAGGRLRHRQVEASARAALVLCGERAHDPHAHRVAERGEHFLERSLGGGRRCHGSTKDRRLFDRSRTDSVPCRCRRTRERRRRVARRIFIAGATGEIGRHLTPALVAAGDDVYGLARTDERAELVRSLGATPVRGDALDRAEMIAALAEAQPEIVVHQLTAIPRSGVNPRKFTESFGPTNRLRREATRHLVDAAVEVGARRVVAQSIAFAYAPEGPDVLDESAPLDTGAEGGWGEIVRAVAALEEAVLGASGLEGVVLRYGQFYGPGTAFAPDGSFGSLVVKRRLPIIGDGGGRQPLIHIEDAAAATVATIGGDATGVYNVTGDESPPARDWIPALADALAARTRRRVPVWLARLAAGPDAVRTMTAQRGASNAKFRRDFAWQPSFPDYRAGFEALAR